MNNTVSLQNTWELPCLKDENCSEIFARDPQGSRHYYDAETKLWSRKEDSSAENILLSDWSSDQEFEALMIMEDLCLMAPDSFPSDCTKISRQAAFIYQDWKFYWVFVPELRRWSLAPVGPV